MKIRVLLIAFASAVVAAASATAQLRDGTFEVNGFAGYLVGGHFGDVPGTPRSTSTDIGSTSATTSTTAAASATTSTALFELEFEYSRTPTHLQIDPFRSNLPTVNFAPLTVQYFMGYLTFNFGRGRSVGVLHHRRRRRRFRRVVHRHRGPVEDVRDGGDRRRVQVLLQSPLRAAFRRAPLFDGRGFKDLLLRLRLLLPRHDVGVELRPQRRLHRRVLRDSGPSSRSRPDARRRRRARSRCVRRPSEEAPPRPPRAATRCRPARPRSTRAGRGPRAPAPTPRADRGRGAGGRSAPSSPAYSCRIAKVGDATCRRRGAETPGQAAREGGLPRAEIPFEVDDVGGRERRRPAARPRPSVSAALRVTTARIAHDRRSPRPERGPASPAARPRSRARGVPRPRAAARAVRPPRRAARPPRPRRRGATGRRRAALPRLPRARRRSRPSRAAAFPSG